MKTSIGLGLVGFASAHHSHRPESRRASAAGQRLPPSPPTGQAFFAENVHWTISDCSSSRPSQACSGVHRANGPLDCLLFRLTPHGQALLQHRQQNLAGGRCAIKCLEPTQQRPPGDQAPPYDQTHAPASRPSQACLGARRANSPPGCLPFRPPRASALPGERRGLTTSWRFSDKDVGFTHPTARSLYRDIRLGKVSSEWAGVELRGGFGE